MPGSDRNLIVAPIADAERDVDAAEEQALSASWSSNNA